MEELFEKYRKDPASIDESWAEILEGFEFCQKNYKAEEGDAFYTPMNSGHEPDHCLPAKGAICSQRPIP